MLCFPFLGQPSPFVPGLVSSSLALHKENPPGWPPGASLPTSILSHFISSLRVSASSEIKTAKLAGSSLKKTWPQALEEPEVPWSHVAWVSASLQLTPVGSQMLPTGQGTRFQRWLWFLILLSLHVSHPEPKGPQVLLWLLLFREAANPELILQEVVQGVSSSCPVTLTRQIFSPKREVSPRTNCALEGNELTKVNHPSQRCVSTQLVPRLKGF